jgi:hypothetical protein
MADPRAESVEPGAFEPSAVRPDAGVVAMTVRCGSLIHATTRFRAREGVVTSPVVTDWAAWMRAGGFFV